MPGPLPADETGLPGGPHYAGQFSSSAGVHAPAATTMTSAVSTPPETDVHFTPALFGAYAETADGAKNDPPRARQPGQALDHLPAFDEAGLWVEVAIDIAVGVPGRKAPANIGRRKSSRCVPPRGKMRKFSCSYPPGDRLARQQVLPSRGRAVPVIGRGSRRAIARAPLPPEPYTSSAP